MDADIEKSSNVESSLMIPLQKLADQSKLADSNLSSSSASGQLGGVYRNAIGFSFSFCNIILYCR